ncbi:MAG: hypothetical protein ACRDFS_11540 [Chloroflexota bacterium]
MRSLIAAGLILALPLYVVLAPRTVSGAAVRQATATVRARTFDPALLDLRAAGLPAGTVPVDNSVLNTPSCDPQTTAPISDEFLIVHSDWCQGLHDVTGVFQDFRLDPSDPVPYVGEWAATVYDSASVAASVAQTIDGSLQANDYVDGTCPLSPNCEVASFEDVAVDPSQRANYYVFYEVWSTANLVGEVAIEFGENGSVTKAQDYLSLLAGKGASLLIAVLSPPKTATPTGTLAASATGARKIKLSFSVRSVKVARGNASPERVANQGSLGIVHLRQRVKLLMFVWFQGISRATEARVNFRLTDRGHVIESRSSLHTLNAAVNGHVMSFWIYGLLRRTGPCSLTGTAVFNGHHQHKTVRFRVTK